MRVVAVVPAYNEQETVGGVVTALVECDVLDEVIVVSDGSVDRTAELARLHGARVIELVSNTGKGAALRIGIDGSEADVYLFMDADLVGLEPRHIRMLLQPVVRGQAEMALGLFGGGRVLTDLAHALAPFLSGQRAVSARVLRRMPQIEITRYGVEVALTRYAKKMRIPISTVKLMELTHRMKEEKLGLWAGLRARMRMYYEIALYLQRGGRN